jgi:predicted TIM-barrel fold metal-dependent hydrolase
MIIDIHTHFWQRELDLSPELEQDLRRAGGAIDNLNITEESYREGIKGVDKAVVFGLRARNTGFHVSNDRVAKFVESSKGKLIGFASADPLGDQDPVGEIQRCVEELGMRGVKLGPTYQGVPPDHERLLEIYAYAEKKGLPVLLHQGATFAHKAPLKFANPVLLEDIAYRFPDLRMIVAHMGHPWIGECITLIRKQPNVYADISALHYRPFQFYNALKLAEEYGADQKLFFGTDFPFTTAASTLEALRGLDAYAAKHNLPPLAAGLVEKLIHRNSLAALKIEEMEPIRSSQED